MPSPTRNRVAVTFMATKEFRDLLETEAKKRDCYMSTIIRDALLIYIKSDVARLP